MAISRLFLYVKLSPVVFSNVYVLICCMSYVGDLVCVMCGIKSVLCAGFSLCYVQFAVTSLVASLRACLASLGRA